MDSINVECYIHSEDDLPEPEPEEDEEDDESDQDASDIWSSAADGGTP
ncbi:MAG: hypothetical protein ACLU3I_15870 [Acutalibacteraceae bacterium]